MGILGETPQDIPLHSGEVFHLWSYLQSAKEVLVTMQVLINHTGDHDLKVLLEDMLENGFTQEEQQVETLLKNTGIRLPPAPPDRPNVELQDIPAGARFNDSEIARLVQKELLSGKMLCSYVTGISMREDIKTMFSEFHTEREEYEVKLLKVMKEKGWLTSPPINIK
ncbi:DUF3231 family protein [Virgibacillus xinjiangensis]|uniref:DUF3231 family protein n=1 Tax=Virgibacillus xinjiangensis TaxID=393090 RepID=A0ABV7CW44_9BACI